jgi:hypothetical protein
MIICRRPYSNPEPAPGTRAPGRFFSIALRLWTFVHGAASLLIDQDYEAIAPNIDVNQLIAGATRPAGRVSAAFEGLKVHVSLAHARVIQKIKEC